MPLRDTVIAEQHELRAGRNVGAHPRGERIQVRGIVVKRRDEPVRNALPAQCLLDRDLDGFRRRHRVVRIERNDHEFVDLAGAREHLGDTVRNRRFAVAHRKTDGPFHQRLEGDSCLLGDDDQRRTRVGPYLRIRFR